MLDDAAAVCREASVHNTGARITGNIIEWSKVPKVTLLLGEFHGH